ncbi:hypothetical protein EV121DRAFT_213495 [Schizophyllum commune]
MATSPTSPPSMGDPPPLDEASPASMGGSPPPHSTPPPHIESSSPRRAPSTPLIGPTLAPRNTSDHPTTPDRCSSIDGLSSACHRKFDTTPLLSPSLVTALSAAAQSRSPSPSMGGSSALSMGGPPPGYPSPLLYRCPPPSPCGTPRLLLNDGHASIAVSGSGAHDKDFAARVEEVLRRRLTVEDGWRLAGESDCGLSSEGGCESDREWRFQPQDPEEDEEELTIYVARPGGMRDDASSAMARNVSNAIMKSDSKMHDVAGSINVSLRAPDLDAALHISDPTPPPSIRWGPGRKSYGVLGTRRTPSSQPTMRSVPSTLVDGAPSAGPVFVPSAGAVFVPSARPNVVQGVRSNAIPIVRPDGTRLDVIARPDAVSSPRLHFPDQQAPNEEMPVMAMQSLRSADMPSPSFDAAYTVSGGLPYSPMSPTARSPSSDVSYITSLTSDSASPTYPASPIASPPFTPTKQRSLAQYRSVTEPLAALGPRSPAPYVGARVSRARFWKTVSEPLQDKLPQAGWSGEHTASERSYDHLGANDSVAPFGADHIASPPTTPGFSQEDEEDWSWALAGGQGAPAGLSADLSPKASRRTSMEEDWRAMQDTSMHTSTQSDRRSSTISGLRSSIDTSTRSSPQSGRRSSTEGTAPMERNWRATQQFDWRASRTGRPVRRSWEVKDRQVSDGGVRKISDGGVRLLSDSDVRSVPDGGVRTISDGDARFVSNSGMASDGRDTTNTSFRRVVSDGRRLDSPLGPMSLPRSPLSPSRGPSSSPRGPLSPSYAPPSRTQRSFARASSTPEGILRHSDDGILRHSDYDILRHSDYDVLRHSDDGILHHSDEGILHQPGTPRHKDSRRTNSARHVHFGGEQRVVSGEQGWRDDRATEDVDPLQNAVDMVRKAIDAVKKAVEPATIADAGSETMNNNVEKSALDDMVYREVMRAALGDGWEAATPTASPRMPTGEQRAPTTSPRKPTASPRQASGSPRKTSDDQSSRLRSKGDEDKKGDKGDAKGSGEGAAKGRGKAPHPRSKRDRRGRPDAKGAKGTQARAPSKSPRKKSKDPSQSRDGRALDEAIRAVMEDEPLPTWQVSKDRTSNVVALQMQALAMSQAASDAKAQAACDAKAQAASEAKAQAAGRLKPQASNSTKSAAARDVKSKSAAQAKPGPASAAMSRAASDAGGLGTGTTTFWDNARGTYVAQNAYTQLAAY